MDVTFEQNYLREMYQTGRTSGKNHRFQPEIIRKYVRVIDLMIDQPNV